MSVQTELLTLKKSPLRSIAGQIIPYLVAVVVAFAAVGVFIGLMGFDVFKAYQTILFTSFRTNNGIVQTLLKFVPLMLQALAFTIPLATGKFNIGGEGQMIVGGIGATAVGILFTDLPGFILLPMVLLAGVVAGRHVGFHPGLAAVQVQYQRDPVHRAAELCLLPDDRFCGQRSLEGPGGGSPDHRPDRRGRLAAAADPAIRRCIRG